MMTSSRPRPIIKSPFRSSLANDQDAEGDTLAPSIVQGPAHGTLVQNADGSFTYTPNANYFGSDAFIYTASDGELDSNLATVGGR